MDSPSTSAAPATDAGPVDSHDSTSGGNSTVDNQNTPRQARGAAPSNPKPSKQPAKQTTDEDPEWDFGDGRKAKRSEVTKRLSETQKGAQKAWAERQEYEKKLNAKMERLKELGIDADEFEKDPRAAFRKAAQAELARQLEEATRDPRELAAEKAQKERDEYKRQLDEQAETKRKAEYQAQVDTQADDIAGHIATALKEHGLPPNPRAAWTMASLLLGARKAGQKISLSDLARRTDEMLNSDIDHYLPQEDGPAIAKRLGPKRVEALRRHLLSEHQSKFNQPNQPKRPAAPKPLIKSEHPNGYHTLDDVLRAEKRR